MVSSMASIIVKPSSRKWVEYAPPFCAAALDKATTSSTSAKFPGGTLSQLTIQTLLDPWLHLPWQPCGQALLHLRGYFFSPITFFEFYCALP